MDKELLKAWKDAGKKMITAHRSGTWEEFLAAREEYRAARSAFFNSYDEDVRG
jgi:hypothetical protein